jgi:26S proteasome regulatory subunit N7
MDRVDGMQIETNAKESAEHESSEITDNVPVIKLPNLELAQWFFLLTLQDFPKKEEIKRKLMGAIQENNMVAFYEEVCKKLQWPVDKDAVDRMTAANQKVLKELEAKTEDAEKNLGESEVRESLLKRAEFLTKIGDKEAALHMYRLTLEKTVGLASKLDIVFAQIRIGLFWNDISLAQRQIEVAKGMIDEGGDWDRRNRLKVYEGLLLMSMRQFLQAAKLFLDTVATFTCEELFDYRTFVFYTIVSTIVSLDRVQLKQKLIDTPEIKTVLHEIPHVGPFLHSFYNGQYSTFLAELSHIVIRMHEDRYLHPHSRYFAREMRIRAYQQFLESYRSVHLESMAKHFGLDTQLLDRELSHFIALGRLNCKIDKVNDVIETNRPDTKNAQYQLVIKQGDHLLNRIQKLSRVINL